MNINKNFSRFSAHYAMVIVAALAASWLLESAPQTHAAISTFDDGIVIGGTSISGGLLLDVNGNIGANQYCNAGGGGCVSAGSIGTVWATSGNDIYNTNSSKVGIGTSNPQQKLHTTGNIRADGRHIFLGSSQDIYGNNGTALYYDSNHSSVAQIILRDASNDQLGRLRGDGGRDIGIMDDQADWAIEHRRDSWTRWLINNSEKMRLTPTGLGIGTTNPNKTLDVNGQIGGQLSHTSGYFKVEPYNSSYDDGSYVQVYYDGNNRILRWNSRESGSGASNLNQYFSGNVGIGTSNPSTKLEVIGHIRTPNQVRANNICDENGNNCSSPVSTSYDNQNLGFDSYGGWTNWNGTSNGDTCNSNNGIYANYTCPVNASKTCRDEQSRSVSCGKGCSTTEYQHRTVTCKRERVMVNVQ